jgi:hypothetical protein
MLLPFSPLLLLELAKLTALLPFDVPRPEQPDGHCDEDNDSGNVTHEK